MKRCTAVSSPTFWRNCWRKRPGGDSPSHIPAPRPCAAATDGSAACPGSSSSPPAASTPWASDESRWPFFAQVAGRGRPERAAPRYQAGSRRRSRGPSVVAQEPICVRIRNYLRKVRARPPPRSSLWSMSSSPTVMRAVAAPSSRTAASAASTHRGDEVAKVQGVGRVWACAPPEALDSSWRKVSGPGSRSAVVAPLHAQPDRADLEGVLLFEPSVAVSAALTD